MRTQQLLPMVFAPSSANTDYMDGPSVQLFLVYAISHGDSETKPANKQKQPIKLQFQYFECFQNATLAVVLFSCIKTKADTEGKTTQSSNFKNIVKHV